MVHKKPIFLSSAGLQVLICFLRASDAASYEEEVK